MMPKRRYRTCLSAVSCVRPGCRRMRIASGPRSCHRRSAGARRAGREDCRPHLPAGSRLAEGQPYPVFEVDPSWPQPHENWLIGYTSAITPDRHGHMWVVQRPSSLKEDELFDQWGAGVECCVPAPPVIEFDENGEVVRSWGGVGGPKAGPDWPRTSTASSWTTTTTSGSRRAVRTTARSTSSRWTASCGSRSAAGSATGEEPNSNDTIVLNQPSNMAVHPKTNEVYISDGYGNRRIIVYDAETGAYKRHWGAYGKRPDDSTPRIPSARAADKPQQFQTVHSVRISNDDMVYVADRVNNRVQVFKTDGTFVNEIFIEKQTGGQGVSSDFGFSPDAAQQFLYVADGSNQRGRGPSTSLPSPAPTCHRILLEREVHRHGRNYGLQAHQLEIARDIQLITGNGVVLADRDGVEGQIGQVVDGDEIRGRRKHQVIALCRNIRGDPVLPGRPTGWWCRQSRSASVKRVAQTPRWHPSPSPRRPLPRKQRELRVRGTAARQASGAQRCYHDRILLWLVDPERAHPLLSLTRLRPVSARCKENVEKPAGTTTEEGRRRAPP